MHPGHRYLHIGELPKTIPVFPLTGALLLPQTRLPLNIFEPRYLAMVDAAMSGSRLIGMIQPKFQDEDMAPKPELSRIGCVGRIIEYAETDDGRYLITLLGIVRFAIAMELETDMPYREVEPDYSAFAKDFSPETAPAVARTRLIAALKPYLEDRDMKTDWEAIDEAPVDSLVDALAMMCPFDPAEKQALLEAPGILERAETLIALLEMANAGSGTPGSSTPMN
jgi:Lon protease-like protein